MHCGNAHILVGPWEMRDPLEKWLQSSGEGTAILFPARTLWRRASASSRKQDGCPQLAKRAGEIERASEEYSKRTGKVPAVSDLAQHMGTTVDEISDSLWKSSHSFIISLEREMYDDEDGAGSTVAESLAIPVPGPHDAAERQNLLECMSKAIDELPEKERQIIALYYNEELTLKEIGAVLGISESRVCQIHSRAVFYLRQKMQIDT